MQFDFAGHLETGPRRVPAISEKFPRIVEMVSDSVDL